MAGRKIVGESSHFVYYALGEFFPVDLPSWQAQFENVYDYVRKRLALEPKEKIKLTFDEPVESTCPSRAFSSDSEIFILADEQTDARQILGVLAHEIGHILTLSAFDNQFQSYLYFEEGYATWAAGDYWINWHGFSSLNQMVKSYQKQSSYIPLSLAMDFTGIVPRSSDIGSDCLVRRDILYTEWAGFIDYLIQRGGTEKLYTLFTSGTKAKTETQENETPPDYQGVYGSTLNQLETDWLSTLGN